MEKPAKPRYKVLCKVEMGKKIRAAAFSNDLREAGRIGECFIECFLLEKGKEAFRVGSFTGEAKVDLWAGRERKLLYSVAILEWDEVVKEYVRPL